jgi:hypothetical protein
MSPKTAATFRIDDEILEGLRAVKDRDRVPISEQGPMGARNVAGVERRQGEDEAQAAVTRKRS